MRHPADAEMERTFLQHEEEFTRVVRMSEQDIHVIRIAQNFTWLDTDSSWPRKEVGISNDRWDQYRKLFRTMGVGDGIVRTENIPVAVLFLASGIGLVPSDSVKGYAYSTRELSPTVGSLDGGLPKTMRHLRHGIAFKRIKHHWYIYLEEYP